MVGAGEVREPFVYRTPPKYCGTQRGLMIGPAGLVRVSGGLQKKAEQTTSKTGRAPVMNLSRSPVNVRIMFG